MHVYGIMLIIAAGWRRADSIELTRLQVPQYADPRAPVRLLCGWELAGETLQSVKWFRDDQPFLEYRARDASYIAHPVEGIHGQHSECGRAQCAAELRVQPLAAVAVYACEVSGEGPRFRTARAERTMAMLALPSSGPQITGLPPTVLPDTDVTLNCTALPSLPPAQLTWLLNDHPVASEQHDLRHADGLFSSWSSIQVSISPDEAKQVECKSEQLGYGRQLSQAKSGVMVAERPALASQYHESSRGSTIITTNVIVNTIVVCALLR